MGSDRQIEGEEDKDSAGVVRNQSNKGEKEREEGNKSGRGTVPVELNREGEGMYTTRDTYSHIMPRAR